MDPVRYHWSYYHTVLNIEESLQSEFYVDVRQKKVLEGYAFLVPIARAFSAEFHDSRYLRLATRHYRRLSENIFYRKLDLTPQMTSELVETSNPFGLWRDPTQERPVLEKYGIVAPAARGIAAVTPEPVTPFTPVAEPSPEPSPSPLPVPSPVEEPPPPEPDPNAGLETHDGTAPVGKALEAPKE